MSFLEKRNPRATRKSTIRAACWGAFFSFVLTAAQLSYLGLTTPMPPAGFFGALVVSMLIFMPAVGAITGAAMHWQQSC
jgi:uncharacterized oligopeptide transporter (OPT) family protein